MTKANVIRILRMQDEAAEREKIEALIREGRQQAKGYRYNLTRFDHARLFDDLADVAQKYLDGLK